MGDLTGQMLGRYEIHERLGHGGMAEVYKAYQPSLDRAVAVKVLHTFLLEQADSRARFAREARAVAALRHPHIVQVIDFDVVGDIYFMVMELIEGPTLRQMIDQQAGMGTRLPLDQVGTIITAIGGALDYAHEQGLIHRDVKPQNIMFTASGQPLLTDFGIAKLLSGANSSGSGHWSGTPAYMSPEQGRGGPLDARTDIYSLGVVLYEMLTGQVPFQAETPFAVVLQHVNDPPPALRLRVPDLPPALEQVVLTALAKAPLDRYPTAAALVAATQTAIATAPPPTNRDPASPVRSPGGPGGGAVDPATLGGQLSGLRKLLGLSQSQVAAWIQGPEDDTPPVERIQHWEHNRRRPRTRRELLTIVREMHQLNPVVITQERIEQLIRTYDPHIPLTANERAALGFVAPVATPEPPAPFAPLPGLVPAVEPASSHPPLPVAGIVAEGLPPSPYRGLFAFREEDAPFFCGRERFTTPLRAAVQERTLVAVLGPSGSGKSSLVFAGLLPELRASGEWLIATSRPGDRPFHSLAAVLIPLLEGSTNMTETDRLVEINKLAERLAAGDVSLADVAYRIVEKAPESERVLLVLDQFEEVYTLAPSTEVRGRFLDCLVQAVRAEWPRRTPAFTLVLTLRADFLGHALADRALADVLQDADLKLGPMTHRELQTAIDEPAAQLGVQIEEGLTERILAAVSSEPGDLPLLEFALALLWEQQQERTLTHSAYDAIGGVEQALAGYAEQVYCALSDPDQGRARRIFTQVVRPGEGTADTRRIATRAEVGETNWDLVTQLADARLVVTGRDAARRSDTVEVVHEALIANWGRLQEWVEADREFRSWQERLRAAVHSWAAASEDEGALLRGVPLTEAGIWLDRREADLSTEEVGFIRVSLALRNRERLGQEAERRVRDRLRRQVTTLLGIGLAVAVLLAVVAALQWQTAAAQQQLAEHRLLLARAQALAAQSLTQEHGGELGLLLALEAVTTTMRVGEPAVPEAVTALHLAIQRSQLRQTWHGHTDELWSAEWSPDGTRVVSASSDGTARVWDAATGQTVLTLTNHTGPVSYAVYSPDGKRIAIAEEHTALIWDATTGRLLLTLKGHTAGVNWVAFSPDNKWIVTSGEDQTARLWDAATGAPGLILRGHTDRVDSATFSPDGTRIVTASGDMTVKIWDAASGKLLNTLTGHKANVLSALYSPDGQYIISGSDYPDSTARVWNAETGELVKSLDGHTDSVHHPMFNPTGTLVVTSSDDQRIIIWEVATWQPLVTLRGHENRIRSAVFSPDGTQIVSASQDQTVRIWDTLGQERPTLLGHEAEVWSFEYRRDGQRVVTAGEDSAARVWDPATGRMLVKLEGHTDSVNSATYSRDGKYLLTASSDQTAKLWDAESGQLLHSLEGNTASVGGVGFSPDGRTIATASEDHSAKLWNTGTGELLHTLGGFASEVWAANFSPDGTRLVTASNDPTVRVWDVATGQVVLTLSGHTAAATSAEWSPDGKTLLTGGDDGTARVWDAATGQVRLILRGHTKAVNHALFSYDGKWVITAGADNTAKIWDATTGQERLTLRGHTARVNWATFNAAGTMVVTASGDGTAKLWDAVTGREISTLPGHTGEITAADFSPDGRTVLTASTDHTVRQYVVNIQDLLALAQTRVTRPFTPEERATYLGEALPTPTPLPVGASGH